MSTKEDKAFNEFIREVRLWADAMFEHVRMGDDGWKEAHEKSYKQLRHTLAEYVMSRQPKPEEPITGTVYAGYKNYDAHDPNRVGEINVIKEWQQKLYAYLKRSINADNGISEISNSSLMVYCESKYIADTQDETLKDNFYNVLMYASFTVLTDVVNELIEFRKNNKQQKLFE